MEVREEVSKSLDINVSIDIWAQVPELKTEIKLWYCLCNADLYLPLAAKQSCPFNLPNTEGEMTLHK